MRGLENATLYTLRDLRLKLFGKAATPLD
jgi:hypothetical protein